MAHIYAAAAHTKTARSMHVYRSSSRVKSPRRTARNSHLAISHLDVVSHVHGKHIYEAGYHVRDYYLKQWDRFKHLPLGVLAHGTHLRGSGTYENGEEYARIQVILASKISAEDCKKLSLGYLTSGCRQPCAWQAHLRSGLSRARLLP